MHHSRRLSDVRGAVRVTGEALHEGGIDALRGRSPHQCVQGLADRLRARAIHTPFDEVVEGHTQLVGDPHRNLGGT
jgi:hypothetical protein